MDHDPEETSCSFLHGGLSCLFLALESCAATLLLENLLQDCSRCVQLFLACGLCLGGSAVEAGGCLTKCGLQLLLLPTEGE